MWLDFAFAHRELFPVHHHFERALQDICHLFALMRVHRHERAALEIYLREHLALARHDFFARVISVIFSSAISSQRWYPHGSHVSPIVP
jgi:hypothetical protein